MPSSSSSSSWVQPSLPSCQFGDDSVLDSSNSSSDCFDDDDSAVWDSSSSSSECSTVYPQGCVVVNESNADPDECPNESFDDDAASECSNETQLAWDDTLAMREECQNRFSMDSMD